MMLKADSIMKHAPCPKTTLTVDEGNAMDVIFLDFAKAFDKVPHRRLLAQLEAHGVEGRVLRWIGAWLADRKQRVILNGAR